MPHSYDFFDSDDDFDIDDENVNDDSDDIEINESLDKNIKEKYMIEWWNAEVKLFIKYLAHANSLFGLRPLYL